MEESADLMQREIMYAHATVSRKIFARHTAIHKENQNHIAVMEDVIVDNVIILYAMHIA
jgi:hypothetical protein